MPATLMTEIKRTIAVVDSSLFGNDWIDSRKDWWLRCDVVKCVDRHTQTPTGNREKRRGVTAFRSDSETLCTQNIAEHWFHNLLHIFELKLLGLLRSGNRGSVAGRTG